MDPKMIAVILRYKMFLWFQSIPLSYLKIYGRFQELINKKPKNNSHDSDESNESYGALKVVLVFKSIYVFHNLL